MDDQVHAEVGHEPVPELVHLVELPRRVHMEEGERRLRRVERLMARCSMTELSLPTE